MYTFHFLLLLLSIHMTLTCHSLLVCSATKTFVSFWLNEDGLSGCPGSSLEEPQPELNLNVPPLSVVFDSPPLLLRLGSSLRSGGNEGCSIIMKTPEVFLLSVGSQNPIAQKRQTGAARIHTVFWYFDEWTCVHNFQFSMSYLYV